jgi:hypothetical protein
MMTMSFSDPSRFLTTQLPEFPAEPHEQHEQQGQACFIACLPSFRFLEIKRAVMPAGPHLNQPNLEIEF